MIRIAIVEDEDRAAEALKEYLGRFFSESDESYSAVRHTNPVHLLDKYEGYDLIFMDIEMPYMNGMEGARRLREIDRQVRLIFVTNMAQFAAKGYEVDAMDFIVKPVSYPDFVFKMKRALTAIQSSKQKDLVISQPFGMVRMGSDGLMYVEVRGHKLFYHFVDRVIEARGTMDSAAEMLAGLSFLRPHNCFLVNPRFIDRVQNYSVFVGNDELMISHPRRKDFMAEFGAWYTRGGS